MGIESGEILVIIPARLLKAAQTEGFIELVYHYAGTEKSIKDAYYRACDELEEYKLAAPIKTLASMRQTMRLTKAKKAKKI